MTTDLDAIRQRINAGDTEGGRWALISLLRRDPENADAWVLMADLSDDPERKADCYRRALRIDPDSKAASDRLFAQTNPGFKEDGAMRCPQCGGAMAVRRIGEMRDKRAVCLYCGTEVDLPDSYQQVVKKRTQEKRIFGSRSVEETRVETRSDGPTLADDQESLPPEIQEMIKSFKDKDFHKRRLSKSVHVKDESWEDQVLTEMFPSVEPAGNRPALSPEDIIQMAGGALPPEERRKCPNLKCNAIISKNDKKCSWCGEAFA